MKKAKTSLEAIHLFFFWKSQVINRRKFANVSRFSDGSRLDLVSCVKYQGAMWRHSLRLLLHGTQEATERVFLLLPRWLFFIKKQNNGYCVRSRGWAVTDSRAAGTRNRATLYSVEGPRWSLALNPDLAGCERPSQMPEFVREYVFA